jgi:hypothetical protein
MPLTHQIRFLRNSARRLREIAGIDANSLARQLHDMATELEQEAAELEQAQRRSGDCAPLQR